MIKRSLVTSFVISALCLLVIGGPLSSALFESPVSVSAATATAAPNTTLFPTHSLTLWVSLGLLGAMTISGAALTLSLQSLRSQDD